jgi:putative transcriptional regulator
MSKPKYKSEAFAAVHDMASALHEVGAIDKKTMRHFDEVSLITVPDFSAAEIKSLRERENVSQPVFARYLAVSKNVVSAWECGNKKPSGPTKRLLGIVERKGLKALVS